MDLDMMGKQVRETMVVDFCHAAKHPRYIELRFRVE